MLPISVIAKAVPRTTFYTQTVRSFPYTQEPQWHGHFSAKNFRAPKEKLELLNYKSKIKKVIKNIPFAHTLPLKKLEVRNINHTSRGMANGKKIILNTGAVRSDEELIALFIHEIGHVVDLGLFTGRSKQKTRFFDGRQPIVADDISTRFYRISWKNSKERKSISKTKDFVSGYAMHNAFEDFAESYLFYRLHGEKFRALMKKSIVLRRKYYFFKNEVFEGQEFQLKKTAKKITPFIWDATLVKYKERDLMN